MAEKFAKNFESERVTHLLASIETTLQEIGAQVPQHSRLREMFEYVTFPGGKRIRPLLALAFCSDLGIDSELIRFPAVALELLHTASLVHDDLPALDNDDQRRGKASCHKVFGEASAIVFADYMTALAFGVASRSAVSTEIATETLQTLSEAYMDVCRGQLLDLNSHTIADLEQLHVLKTGSLFAASFKIAALSAARSQDFCADSKLLGLRIGLIFQIVDDYLDIFGTDLQRGRSHSSDIRNDKVTYFSALSREQGFAMLSKHKTAIELLVSKLEASAKKPQSFLLTRCLIEKILSAVEI